MSLRLLTLSLLIFFACEFTHADDARLQPSLAQHELTHWDTNDGLNQNTVRAIVELPDGHMVVGSYEGLMLFDGLSFNAFPDNPDHDLNRNTTQITIDGNDVVWVGGTDIGLYRLDPIPHSQQQAIRARYRGAKDDANGLLTVDHVTALSADDQNVWVGTPAGLLRFDGERWSQQALPEQRSAFISALWSEQGLTVAANEDGQIWLINEDGPILAELKEARDYGRIWAISGDSQRIYFGTNDGVGVLNKNGVTVDWLGRKQGLGSERVATLATVDGALLIGGYGGGLYRWRPDETIDQLSIKNGLENDYIQSLYVDSAGVIWMGTSAGLTRIYPAEFVTIGMSQGLSSRPVRAVLGDDEGALWVGVDASQGAAGLHRVDPDGQITRFGAENGLQGAAVRALAIGASPEQARTVWAASYGEGLSYLAPDGKMRQPAWANELPSMRLRAIHFDRQGRFWLLSDNQGIWRRETDGTLVNVNQALGLNSERFNHIIETEEAFWLGSFGEGVARWEAEQGITQWNREEDGLPSTTLLTLFEDRDGMIWAGTDRGPAYFDGNRWQQPLVADTPWQSAVLSMAHDRFNGFWICFNGGIIRMDKTALINAREEPPPYRHYSHRDGLRSAQCNGGNQPANWVEDGERLWFATADGLAGIAINGKVEHSPLSRPVVESIVSGGEEVLAQLTGELVLSPDVQRLVFQFASPTTVSPEDVQYRYRMDSFDTQWAQAGVSQSAQYTGLTPGKHTFSVQAKRPGQPWSEARSNQLHFVRQPHWTETSTFKLLSVAAAATLLLLIYRLRMRSLKARAAMLQQHVDERTQALQATIEELSNTRSQLLDAQRFASMARMLAGISHELNTPLGNSLVVSSRLSQVCKEVRAQLGSQQPSRKRIEQGVDDLENGLGLINGSISKAANLLKRLREASAAAREEERETFSVSDLLNELPAVVGDRECSRLCQLRVHCPAELNLSSYPRILRDVILELIDNSAEHGFDKQPGEITITVEQGPRDSIEINYCDKGKGIEEGRHASIFEPMSRAMSDNEHSGLGMHRVYNQITGVLGGSIKLCPNTGGVCFIIQLPNL